VREPEGKGGIVQKKNFKRLGREKPEKKRINKK